MTNTKEIPTIDFSKGDYTTYKAALEGLTIQQVHDAINDAEAQGADYTDEREFLVNSIIAYHKENA